MGDDDELRASVGGLLGDLPRCVEQASRAVVTAEADRRGRRRRVAATDADAGESAAAAACIAERRAPKVSARPVTMSTSTGAAGQTTARQSTRSMRKAPIWRELSPPR
nr:unnamed protein product [Digitaria exilis]